MLDDELSRLLQLLFCDGDDPVARRKLLVRLFKCTIVGVFDEKKSAFGGGYDNYVLMPVTTFVNTYGMTDRNGFERSVNITVHAKSPELISDAIEGTRQVLRRVRGVRRGEKDNFEYFNSESSINEFNQMTAGIKVGAFIGGIIGVALGSGALFTPSSNRIHDRAR